MSSSFDLTSFSADNIRKFSSPEIIFGEGAFLLLGHYAAQFQTRQALLVTDAGVRRAGWAGRAEELLRREGVRWVLFEQETFDPSDSEIMAGSDEYQRWRCNMIVAVGGGSVIDCAKGICAVIGNGRHILSLTGGAEPILPGPPLISAPTTPGSGAEASQFVVLKDTSRMFQVAAVGRALVPSLSLVDPLTSATLLPIMLAGGCLDALSHAIEAYVSTASSPLTDLHAIEAARVLGKLLSEPEIDPTSAEQRAVASLGGLHAGLAFSNAGGGLAHALSNAMESLTGMKHHSVIARVLPVAVRYNYGAAALRYEQIGRAFGAEPYPDAKDPSDWFVQKLETWSGPVGIPQLAARLNLPEGWPARASELALADIFIATNPIIPGPGELEGWLAQMMM